MPFSPTYERLIARLRNLRQTSGLTQAQVVVGLPISRSQYTAIEGGHSMLTVENLICLAQVHDVTVGQLVGGIDEMPRPAGSRVVRCPGCDKRVVGMPGQTVVCPTCAELVRIPHSPK